MMAAASEALTVVALLQLELMELRKQQQDMEDFTKQEQRSDSRYGSTSVAPGHPWSPPATLDLSLLFPAGGKTPALETSRRNCAP